MQSANFFKVVMDVVLKMFADVFCTQKIGHTVRFFDIMILRGDIGGYT